MRFMSLVASLALASTAGAASAASIVNGSFELGINPGQFTQLNTGSTAITGWTVSAGTVDYIGTYWSAQDGGRSIDLAGGSPGALSQTFTTSVGDTYRVTYWIARNPDSGIDPRTGFATVGGSTVQFSYAGSGNRSNMQWQQEFIDFTATSTSASLTFAADPATANGFFGPALDNVSIATIAGVVPEPSAWALMILGFGVAGAAMRRRRKVRFSFA